MSPLKQRILFIFIVILLNVSFVRVSSFPQNRAENGDTNDSGSSTVDNDNGDVSEMEIITVDEIVRDSNVNLAKNSTVVAKAALIKPNNEASISSSSSTFTSTPTANIQNDASNEPTLIDIADDLIFLEKRPQQQHDIDEAELVKARKIPQQQQKQRSTTPATPSSSSSTSSVGTFQQIDLLTSAEEDSLTAISSSTTARAASKSNEAQDYVAKAVDGGDGDGASTTTSPIKHVIADKEVGGIVVDEDEVSLDESDDDDDEDVAAADLVAIAPVTAATPIDMSDFVALIPVGAVKTIVTNYYRNDPEVQRAYAYLSSPDFVVVRQHIIVLPEVQAFLRYLNSSGLDVMGFLSTITNLTRKPDALAVTTKTLEDNFTDEDIGSGSDAVMANEIDNGNRLNQQSTTISHQAADSTANTEEPAKGLHGLVDSVLEVLPQDQILATFFDKLESNEQFTRLVDNIGQPAFAKILHNLQNSAQLRTLVFTLHNHGIYVAKIVDSLKAYFFLGTF